MTHAPPFQSKRLALHRTWRILRGLWAASVARQLQDRAALVLQLLANLVMTFIEFLAAWALIHRFGSLAGWTLAEVALGYGLTTTAHALANTFGKPVADLDGLILRGEVDRLLLRPCPLLLHLVGSDLHLRTIGRLVQAVGVLAWALVACDVAWSPGQVLLLGWMLLGGIALFAGLQLLQGAVQFWTIEGGEVGNVLTYGTVTMGQYPLAIFPPVLRWAFLTVIPLGCVVYLPLLALLQRPDPLGSPTWLQLAGPVAGLGFLGLSLLVWRAGVRRYASTGS